MKTSTDPSDVGDASTARGRPLELLTFRSGGQGYAVDIMAVREIRGWSEPTPLPHAPASCAGWSTCAARCCR